ncbi:TPA: hypothetical protein JG855_002066 [Vibrio parahaemolyticus]|uniref:hypothetical protein n=1 Tax=Vibrio TaxID=662 RepID=UPI0013032A09|nr:MULTISPECIES: hypothetical protein [Vibrio]HAV1497976.1 hypothetical protein [Vibrio parahaemolyticus]MCG6354781.1 hypothetical protein [Vibrio alginolyticus]MCK8112492.1 hypothetical protein [Vibrio sp. 2CM40D]HAV1503145.1 hypothetical protein [Vibrio parahaemolyticus]HBL4682760.1 hypothetical protein [Vibrio parahaemolyticus]
MAKIEFPTGVIISNVSITHEIPTLQTESLSLTSRGRTRGIHRIKGSFDVHITDFEAQQAWTAFLLKMQGRFNSFELDLPRHFKSDARNPQLTLAAGIGASTLSVNGGNYVKVGTCFNVPNDNKTYYITDINGDQFTIFPKLRTAQLVNTEINVQTPVINCRFAEDNQTVTYSENGMLIKQTINFVEVF